MSNAATVRYVFDKNYKPVKSGAVLPGQYYEEYDQDGNPVFKGIADAYMRPIQINYNTPRSSVYYDKELGEDRYSRRQTSSAATRRGRIIREREERVAAKRAARQDKLDKANAYYESLKDRIGAREPTPSMSDADLDNYIALAESLYKHELNPLDAKRDKYLADARKAINDRNAKFLKEQKQKRLDNLKKGATKVFDNTKSFAERQRENVESIRAELKPGEKIKTRIVETRISPDPRIKTMARPVATFDYGDGKMVPLKKSPYEQYRGKDGIVRNTPEDLDADLTAKIMRENASEAERSAVGIKNYQREREQQAARDKAAENMRIAMRKNKRAQAMPNYNPSRSDLDTIRAMRRQLDAYAQSRS